MECVYNIIAIAIALWVITFVIQIIWGFVILGVLAIAEIAKTGAGKIILLSAAGTLIAFAALFFIELYRL